MSGLPCCSLGDCPNPGIKPRYPTLQVDSSPSEPPGKPHITRHIEKGSPSPEDTTETEAGASSPLVCKGRVCIQHKVLEAGLWRPLLCPFPTRESRAGVSRGRSIHAVAGLRIPWVPWEILEHLVFVHCYCCLVNQSHPITMM